MIFGGDVTFGNVIDYHVKMKNCTFHESFENIKDELRNADITIVNLETPLRIGNETMKELYPNKSINMISDTKAIAALRDAGVDVVTLANNHIQDFGDISINRTVDALQSNEIKYFGLSHGNRTYSKQDTAIVSHNGIKIGFLGYCVNTIEGCNKDQRLLSSMGAAIYNSHMALQEIKELRKNVDIIIIFFHWGTEFTQIPTHIEVFDQIMKLHSYVDLIVGCHPHVQQDHFYYRKKLVVTSLGNLLFPMNMAPNTVYSHDGGEEKKPNPKLEAAWYKAQKTLRNPTAFGKLLKVEFNKKGIIKKKSKYLTVQIDANERHCLHIKKTRTAQRKGWVNICSKNDPQCIGTENCNPIECNGINSSK